MSVTRLESLPRRVVGAAGESGRVSELTKSGTKNSVAGNSKPRRVIRSNGRGSAVKYGKVAPECDDFASVSAIIREKKRCGWITAHSDLLHVCFHDEEWGVPVHDDAKLFELLVLSEAFGELSWPTILHKRDTFRKLFDNFDVGSVANFSEKKLLVLKESGNAVMSEQKLRAVVENALQTLKIAKEFGSFSNYIWSFVNRKPIVNGFRYARQVPSKTPKAEVISKDLMRRGFRCVGPSIVYTFMQVAGIVNDHLSSCFRFKECNLNIKHIENQA